MFRVIVDPLTGDALKCVDWKLYYGVVIGIVGNL